MKKESVLITNHQLENFCGSEINALEHAICFKNKGYDVSVATLIQGQPMADEFAKEGIKVFDLSKSSEIDNITFDIGWIHHVPVFLHALSKGIRFNRAIFNSLGYYEPLETPPCFADSFDLVCFNSKESYTKLCELELIPEGITYAIRPNGVLLEQFSNPKEKHSEEIKKIAVISNHIPQELIEIKEYFEKVDYYGVNGNIKNIRITAEILQQYDAIIAIGKTVQYAICLKLPIYCYDHFGGSGWVTYENYKLMEEYNFSGRDSNRKMTSIQIKDELIEGYKNTLAGINRLYSLGLTEYDMDVQLSKILSILSCKKNFMNKISMQVKNHIRLNEYYLRNLEDSRSAKYLLEHEKLKSEYYTNLINSKSWRITAPLRFVANIFRKVSNKLK